MQEEEEEGGAARKEATGCRVAHRSSSPGRTSEPPLITVWGYPVTDTAGFVRCQTGRLEEAPAAGEGPKGLPPGRGTRSS